jgi:hypothetical protein
MDHADAFSEGPVIVSSTPGTWYSNAVFTPMPLVDFYNGKMSIYFAGTSGSGWIGPGSIGVQQMLIRRKVNCQ